MTWMYPAYDQVEMNAKASQSKYALFEYREAGQIRPARAELPVLFVPGNAGSYKQARSLGAVADAWASSEFALRVYTIDTGDELAAFDALLLEEQAVFVNQAISVILQRHRSVSSIVLVAHSMGGKVAQLLFTLPNYVNASVSNIITLASPQTHPPIAIELSMVHLYETVNRIWASRFTDNVVSSDFRNLMVVSIAGGDRDAMIPSAFAEIDSFIPKSHGFSSYSTSIPDVWVSADHRCILWCNQLVHVLVKGLYNLFETDSDGSVAVLPLEQRVAFWKNLLQPSLKADSLSVKGSGTALNLPKSRVSFKNHLTKQFFLTSLSNPGTSEYHILHTSPKFITKAFAREAKFEIYACASPTIITVKDLKTSVCHSIRYSTRRIAEKFPDRTDGVVDAVVEILDFNGRDLSRYNISTIVVHILDISGNGEIGVEVQDISDNKDDRDGHIVVSGYNFRDVIFDKFFSIPITSISTILELSDIKDSMLVYDMRLRNEVSCTYRIGQPLIHVSITGTSESKILFPWPKDSYPIRFHKDANAGLLFNIFVSLKDLSNCPSQKYMMQLHVNWLATAANIIRRAFSLILVFVGAISTSVFLDSAIFDSEL
ncbi:GPI inositol deacylase [Physocladia obscura]|uniref:GPI inositol-deacylase n=1 Tax=Physocladia obscura TaxID=109957 RepID=A0AAD5SWL8_9FUNG|nr:GPI inositol deacylase [Physocladia obscura]